MTDADALARFEALCQSQVPASQPWTPVTDYSFEARRPLEEPHAALIKDTFAPTYVIDAGCGPNAHLALLLGAMGISGTAFDTQLRADWCVNDKWFERIACTNEAMNMCTVWDIFKASLTNDLAWGTKPKSQGDLVICREVLEHLTIQQIRKAVTNLCRLSSRYVYITTRFHPNPQHLLDVATSDDLDPTHITMLNQDFLRTLFVLEGFARRPDLETAMDWQHKGRVLVYERCAA